MLVLKGLVGLHRTIQLQLLQHYWLGHRLGLLWYCMVCLGNEQRSFCHFWDFIQVLNFDSSVDHDGYSISSKGFLPTVVGIMVIRVKLTHSSHFSSPIPRMSVFTLAISHLTTSNLPWFMDLTFQVPMQYCSLQPQNLLLSPVTSTTGYCFCFGPIPSFFLELGFRKGRGTRDQIANILWIIEKAREFQKKHLFLLFWLCQSLWLCGS